MRRKTGKPTIAALGAIAAGALVWSKNGSPVVSIIVAVVAGVVCWIVWGLFENLLYKAADKGTQKVEDAVQNAYQKHLDKKNSQL